MDHVKDKMKDKSATRGNMSFLAIAGFPRKRCFTVRNNSTMMTTGRDVLEMFQATISINCTRPLSQLSNVITKIKVIRVFRAINLAQIELFDSEVRVQVQASLRLSLAQNPTRRGDQIYSYLHTRNHLKC